VESLSLSLRPAAGENPLGGPVLHFDVAESTNEEARELAAGGAPPGTVVLAEEQTAGRGRQGRSWVAPRGRALTLSVVVRAGDEQLALLPLTAAVATCEACEQVARVECAVKWPNDVWIDERKVAGILIEARPQERWAVVGIGLNVETNVEELAPDLRDTATSLRIATGAEVARGPVLDALLERLAEWLAAGRDRLLSAYRERDALFGRSIAWIAGSQRLEGEARGVDEEGNLVVFTADGGRMILAAGEVHLAGAGTSQNPQ
jgi:BirA family transcriptional regulator, biotin operon repressor / biotin---[acetyl-CoA-carboxylase] ligase